jgi:hypothetical protein
MGFFSYRSAGAPASIAAFIFKCVYVSVGLLCFLHGACFFFVFLVPVREPNH